MASDGDDDTPAVPSAEPPSDAADGGPPLASILERCEAHGLRMTEQRRVVATILAEADDHPDAEDLYRRASEIDPNISLSTVYRTVKLFEDVGILERRDFRDGRARYEDAERDHHDHLIDVNTGEVIEFVDDEIEALQRKVAARLGFDLVDHRLELYGVRRGRAPKRPARADTDREPRADADQGAERDAERDASPKSGAD